MSTAIEAPFDLWAFVGCDETREALMRPFRKDDFVFATDGRIMVRVAASLFPDVQPNAEAPQGADEIIPKPADGEHWMPPTEEMRAVVPDERCGCCGSRLVMQVAMSVAHVRLNRFYVHKLCQLPGVEIYLPPDLEQHQAVPFRFSHGIGALMQMRNDA